jgi:hypothetical protein
LVAGELGRAKEIFSKRYAGPREDPKNAPKLLVAIVLRDFSWNRVHKRNSSTFGQSAKRQSRLIKACVEQPEPPTIFCVFRSLFVAQINLTFS